MLQKGKEKEECTGDDLAQIEIFVLIFWSALKRFSDFGGFVSMFDDWFYFHVLHFFLCLTVGVAGWEVDYWRLPREAVTCPIVGLAKVRWSVVQFCHACVDVDTCIVG